MAEQAADPLIRLSIANLLAETTQELRQPYIDWIGKLSEINNSLEWWSSGLAEKNPFDKLYIEICLLAVARRLIQAKKNEQLLLVSSSMALLREIVNFAHETQVTADHELFARLPQHRRSQLFHKPYRMVRRIAGHLYRGNPRSQYEEHIYRKKILNASAGNISKAFSGDNTVLVFTWVDWRNFTSSGDYTDPNFGNLPDALRKQGLKIGYVPRVLPTIPFKKAVSRLLKTEESWFFPESFVTTDDLTYCQKQAASYEPTVPSDSSVEGIPVHSLASEQIKRDRYHLADSLIYERLIANLAAASIRPRQILHTCEGHSWERVVAWSVRQHMPDTKVVGYDIGTYSKLHLAMYPASREHKIRPLPDRIVTNGPSPAGTLVAGGLPENVVISGYAARYSELSHRHEHDENKPRRQVGSKVRILVATSIHLGDSIDLISKSSQAFSNNPDIEVIVKCHPVVDKQQVMHHINKAGTPNNLSFTDRSIVEILPSITIVLYTHTNVCYEALGYGCIPVFVKSENFLNLDKLEATPDIRWEATTPADLVGVVSEIINMSETEFQVWTTRAKETLRAAMDPSSDKNVRAFLI